jgi:CRP-like cAMP-binding protein
MTDMRNARGVSMDRKNYIPDSPYLTDNLTDHPEELSLLLSISKPKRYAAGGLIYVQGEESKPYFYLIEQGKVKISLLGKDGSEKIIVIQERNTLFGYAATFRWSSVFSYCNFCGRNDA